MLEVVSRDLGKTVDCGKFLLNQNGGQHCIWSLNYSVTGQSLTFSQQDIVGIVGNCDSGHVA